MSVLGVGEGGCNNIDECKSVLQKGFWYMFGLVSGPDIGPIVSGAGETDFRLVRLLRVVQSGR